MLQVGFLLDCGYNAGVNQPLLAIKIGNSNITLGVFENGTLLARWRVRTEVIKTADEYAILFDDFFANVGTGLVPARAAIVSVVPPLTSTFVELCRAHWRVEPLVITASTNTGMPILYDAPHALGTDRIVAAVAAKTKFGAPVIVIDFGTATTFNAVTRAGQFAGGAITPGLHLAADALYRATAQLPRVDLALPPRAIATNTTHGIQSGILIGYLGMIEGMVARMRAELDALAARVVATGGYARLLAPHSRVIDAVEPDLILEGLQIIYAMNQRE
ncbi:MAG: type III pantothenate kinase [Chloroflexi bacterium]|nr:type III pantothenate kinase [Chloroflexota bacterium]